MVKLLVASASLLLLYLGFIGLNQLDSPVLVNWYDYSIKTSLFTLIASFTILIILVTIILKITWIIFALPRLISKKLRYPPDHQLTDNLIKLIAQIVSNNQLTLLKIDQKLVAKLQNHHRQVQLLILAQLADTSQQRVQHLQELLGFKNYQDFALKRLAQTLLAQGNYKSALEYALKAFNLDSQDNDIFEVLITCYAKLSLWLKFTMITSQLKIINLSKWLDMTPVIGQYYFLAAQSYLELKQPQLATEYLRLGLECCPADQQFLTLYLSLQDGKLLEQSRAALAAGFAARPSFAIIDLYVEFANLPALDIYQTIANLASPQQHFSLFLAMAAYLDLPEKIIALKAHRSITNQTI